MTSACAYGRYRPKHAVRFSMTITDVRALVSDGDCTWLQVREPLINAGTTHRTRRRYLDGAVGLAPSSNAMLGELVRSGIVPLSRSDRRWLGFGELPTHR